MYIIQNINTISIDIVYIYIAIYVIIYIFITHRVHHRVKAIGRKTRDSERILHGGRGPAGWTRTHRLSRRLNVANWNITMKKMG